MGGRKEVRICSFVFFFFFKPLLHFFTEGGPNRSFLAMETFCSVKKNKKTKQQEHKKQTATNLFFLDMDSSKATFACRWLSCKKFPEIKISQKKILLSLPFIFFFFFRTFAIKDFMHLSSCIKMMLKRSGALICGNHIHFPFFCSSHPIYKKWLIPLSPNTISSLPLSPANSAVLGTVALKKIIFTCGGSIIITSSQTTPRSESLM